MFLGPNVANQSCTHITIGVGNDIQAEVAMLKQLSASTCDADLENFCESFECAKLVLEESGI